MLARPITTIPRTTWYTTYFDRYVLSQINLH